MSTKFNTDAVLSAVVSACEAAAIHWENMARDEMDMFEDEDLIMELDEAQFEELDDDLLKPRQVRDVGLAHSCSRVYTCYGLVNLQALGVDGGPAISSDSLQSPDGTRCHRHSTVAAPLLNSVSGLRHHVWIGDGHLVPHSS